MVLSGDNHPYVVATTRRESFTTGQLRDFWNVVYTAKVRKHDTAYRSAQVNTNELGQRFVGQVSTAASNPGAGRGRVRAYPQQFDCVIGFDDEHVTILELLDQVSGHCANVGSKTDRAIFRVNTKG